MREHFDVTFRLFQQLGRFRSPRGAFIKATVRPKMTPLHVKQPCEYINSSVFERSKMRVGRVTFDFVRFLFRFGLPLWNFSGTGKSVRVNKVHSISFDLIRNKMRKYLQNEQISQKYRSKSNLPAPLNSLTTLKFNNKSFDGNCVPVGVRIVKLVRGGT